MSSALARMLARRDTVPAPSFAHKFNSWDQRGDADGSITPLLTRRASGVMTFARSATAYQQRIATPPLVALTANKPRESEAIDASGKSRIGILIEKQSENIQRPSNTVALYGYTDEIPSVNANAYAGAYGAMTAYGCNEHVGSGPPPRVYLYAYHTPGVTTYSIRVKRTSRDWILIRSENGLAKATFNISTLALGSVNVGTTERGIAQVNGGWVVPWIKYSHAITGTRTPWITIQNSDGDAPSYTGDGREALIIDHKQIEINDYPTSDIVTTSVAVTRAADSLKFPSQYLIGASLGTARGAFLSPTFTPGREHTIFCLSDNEAAEDHMRVYVDTDGSLKFASAMTGGSAGVIALTGNVCDNVVREWLLAWSPDKVILACRPINGAIVWGMDTDVDIPAVHEADGFCHVGSYAAGTEPGPMLICSLKLSDKFHPSFAGNAGGFTEMF